MCCAVLCAVFVCIDSICYRIDVNVGRVGQRQEVWRNRIINIKRDLKLVCFGRHKFQQKYDTRTRVRTTKQKQKNDRRNCPRL